MSRLVLRPKVLHSMEGGDEAEVLLPGPTLVILEEPQTPTTGTQQKHKRGKRAVWITGEMAGGTSHCYQDN